MKDRIHVREAVITPSNRKSVLRKIKRQLTIDNIQDIQYSSNFENEGGHITFNLKRIAGINV